MNTKNTINMTEGNVLRHLLIYSLPLFIGNMFQQFYNMVDSLVVGNYVGANSLAAIGSCGSINFLFFSLSAGLANGIGVIISQYFGARDEKGLKATVANSFYVLVTASVFTTLLGLLVARPILVAMSTPAEILDDAVLYLRTTCMGILFIALYNDVAATLRALGDSKTPLYFLIMSSFLNIGLDLTFVLVLHKGVFGVALATVISQGISALVSLIYAYFKVPYFRLSKPELKPNQQIIYQSIRLGVPIALQSSMIAISMMVLQGVVNRFGTVVMAAYTISAKVDLIVSQLYGAMSMAMTTYAGQNIGAGKTDRVKVGFKEGILIVTIYNLIIVPIIYVFSPFIVDVFVSETDAAVIDIGATALRITCFMYFALGLIYIPRGIMNGCGDAAFSMINGITEVLCRIVYANLLTSIAFIGQWGIWWAAGLTWITVMTVCMLRYASGKWKLTGSRVSNLPHD